MENNVVNLFSWEVFDCFWGTAVREKHTGKWNRVYLKPDGKEIDLDGVTVDIHENGIEFY